MRLNKFLAQSGIASRRNCDKIIFAGHVKINGKVVITPQTQVCLEKDIVSFKKQTIKLTTKHYYYLFNKPQKVHCSHKRKSQEKLVYDFFQHIPAKLFTVGRLDSDTTGLLFLTTDGTFANQVIHPSYNTEKEYLVKVQQNITHEHLVLLSEKIMIDGKTIQAAKVKKMRRGTCLITIADGKKHEIKHLVHHAKLHLLELQRIRIGSIHLGKLPIGAYREMKKSEILSFH